MKILENPVKNTILNLKSPEIL